MRLSDHKVKRIAPVTKAQEKEVAPRRAGDSWWWCVDCGAIIVARSADEAEGASGYAFDTVILYPPKRGARCRDDRFPANI